MTSDMLHADSQPTASMVPSLAIVLAGTAVGVSQRCFWRRKRHGKYGRRTGETMREWAMARPICSPLSEGQ